MEKKLYLIAELDEETQEKIKSYEKIIAENGITGRQTRDIPYHLTLAEYSVQHENYLVGLVEKIRMEFNEFAIIYSGLGLFGLEVLFLNPAMNIRLLELYNLAKENSLYPENDFTPHTTLLIDTPENILKILPKLVGIPGIIEGKMKFIGLYEFFPKRLVKRIELSSQK